MTDKVKNTASNIFSKTKKEFFRTTQKVMVKVGKAEETVDIQFRQEEERFRNNYRQLKKVKIHLVQLMETVKTLAVNEATLAQDLFELYDTKATNYNALMKNQDIAKLLDGARLAFDDQIKADFLDPLSKYLGQCQEAKNRIKERHTRSVDMDRYGRELRNYQEKATNPQKIQVTEQKYEAAKTNFAALNEELLEDLPKLYEDRIPFFDPLIATYTTALAEYYRQAAKSTAEILPLVSHIDRQAVHTHPRVITPNETSSMRFKASVGNSPSAINQSQQAYSQQQSQPYGGNDDPYSNQGNLYPQASAPPAQPVVPAKPKPVVPQKQLKARALFDFAPQESNELGFKINDTIIIHNTKGDWWEGELNGKRGLLPSNYVQLLE